MSTNSPYYGIFLKKINFWFGYQFVDLTEPTKKALTCLESEELIK